jgi:hypothetical protein
VTRAAGAAREPARARRGELDGRLEALRQRRGDALDRLGPPVRVGREEGAGREDVRGRVEDVDAARRELRDELGVGAVLDRRARAVPAREARRLDDGLHGRGDDDEPDAAPGELLRERADRRHRIGLRRLLARAGAVAAALERVRLEEPRVDDVVDVRAVVEPPVATGIHLLVSHSEAAREGDLEPREQPRADDRVVLQRPLEALERAGARDAGEERRDVRRPLCELDRRDGQEREQEERDERHGQAAADLGVPELALRLLLSCFAGEGHQNMK